MDNKELLNMTIQEIKAFPDTGDAFISLLEQDPRAGVKAYAKTLKRRKALENEKIEQTRERKRLDEEYYAKGYKLICGIDEVGRGPLAGPVVTAAVILPEDSLITGVNDSKKLSRKERERLDELIRDEALAYAYGSISPAHIDQINIYNATKKAMVSAVARLKVKPDLLLIDAMRLHTEIEEISIVKGDALSYSIGAASILAKVKRDNYMIQMSEKYPEYGFERNVGYGTKEHIEAIKKYGLTPIHRRSFCKNFS